MDLSHDIILPDVTKGRDLKNVFESFDKLIENIILYLAYAIAVLCGLKFVISFINGFTTKSYMGSTALDDSSFFR